MESLKINFFLRKERSREESKRLERELSRLGKTRLATSTAEFGMPQFFVETKLGKKQVRRVVVKLMFRMNIKGSFTCQEEEKKKNEREMELA